MLYSPIHGTSIIHVHTYTQYDLLFVVPSTIFTVTAIEQQSNGPSRTTASCTIPSPSTTLYEEDSNSTRTAVESN